MEETKKQPAKKADHYHETKGGRKTAIARARLHDSGKKGITVNDQDYTEYFRTPRQQFAVRSPLELVSKGDASVTVRVRGGGTAAQSEAVRNAIAKALALSDPELKKVLRTAGFITRDARMVERKKFGLKKARRAPQWKKR